jgi:hypothetical protein
MRTMQKLLCGGILMFIFMTLGVYAQYVVNFEGAGETKAGYASGNVNLSGLDWNLTETLIGTSTADKKNGVRSARMRTNEVAALTMLEDLSTGLGNISFLHAKYGTDGNSEVTLEYSIDAGVSWITVAAVPVTTDTLISYSTNLNVEGSARIRIRKTSGGPTARPNIDDITITPFSASGFFVSLDKSDGFVITGGAEQVITASVIGGTEPYDFAWTSSLSATHYTASGNEFTVLASAPVGNYSVTVTVTDDESEEASSSIDFSIVPQYTINISTANGTVTTSPEGAAIAGATVTVTATPDAGFYRSALTVVGDVSEESISLTGTTFTMPAEAVTVTAVFSPYVLPEGVLLGWEVQGLGTESSVSSIANVSGLLPSTISIENSSLIATSGANALNINNWSTNGTLQEAIADESYYEFSVSAVSGNTFDIDQIAWRIVRSSGGPNTFALLSSVGGFADTAIIGSVLTYTNTSAASLNPAFEDVGIAGQTQVTFRVYGWGALGTSGSARITDGGNFGGATAPGLDFAVFGSVDGEGPGPDPDAVEVTGFTVVGGNPAATFTAVAGRSYYLVYTTDLTAITTVTPPVLGQWQVAASITDATAGIQTLTDTSATDAARFYGILETLSPLP